MDARTDPWVQHVGGTTLDWPRVLYDPTPPTPAAWCAAKLLARLTDDDARGILGVTPRTLRRYASGETTVPCATWKLALVMAGWCPWDGWTGWLNVGGRLYDPDDPYNGWHPNELRSVRSFIALARHFDRESRTVDTISEGT